MPGPCRIALCFLIAALLGPGCDLLVPPPKPEGAALARMPARIDAMMTSRFDIIRDGPLVARADESLQEIVRLAELDTPPFLRLLDSMRPAAFSNGGSIIYLTKGSVLLANDAQVFMMLAHEVAHLEAQNLASTQHEKAIIRAAEAAAADARERRDSDDTCGDDDADDAFGGFPVPEDEQDDRGPLESLTGEILCNVGEAVVSIAVETAAESVRSGAEERWSLIEGQMDARAFELGRVAGYDRAELMSVFSLLHNNASSVPFLVERTRRLSAIPGIDRVSIQIPVGRTPVELADRFGDEALELLHDIGRDSNLAPEYRIARIETQATDLLPVYGESDVFLRGYYGYLIGYGGAVGIDPVLLRRAVTGLAALPHQGDAPVAEVWFGCEALRLKPSVVDELSGLAAFPDRRLATETRQVLLDDSHVERVTKCGTDS